MTQQQTTESVRVAARGDRWRAVPVMHDRVIGRKRHIVGAGQRTAACGVTVHVSTSWVENRNKPKCEGCLLMAPDPDNTVVVAPVRTAAQREADRQNILDRAADVRARNRVEEGRRDDPTRTHPPEKPEWDLRYGYGYPEPPVTEPRKWKDTGAPEHTNPHVLLAYLDRRLDYAEGRMGFALEEVARARKNRDEIRQQVIDARRKAGICVRCGEQPCICEEKGKE